MAARPAMAPVAKPRTLGEIWVTTTAMAAWPLAARAAVPAVMCTTMPPAKSEDAHRAEEAGLAPNHMGDRHVDQQTPQAAEPHDGREFHAFGKGADKESRRNDGEGHLEDKEQQFGDIPHKCFTGDAQEEGLGKLPIKGLLAVKARL